MLDRNEWVIVHWFPDGGLLVRCRWQWEQVARNYSHKWEYTTTGLTKQEAENYSKLLKE